MQQPTKNLDAQHFAKPQAARPATTGEVSDLEKDLVNYIFHKVCETWGLPLYELHVGDEATLRVKKRDWAKDFITALNCRRQNNETQDEWIFRAKSKVDRVFSGIRCELDNKKQWEFPNLRRVCSFMAHFVVSPAHQPYQRNFALEDQSNTEAARAAGERELAKMRRALGMNTRGAA